MSWIADAHREWHEVAAAEGISPAQCPLDCYAAEIAAEDAYWAAVMEDHEAGEMTAPEPEPVTIGDPWVDPWCVEPPF